MVGLALKRDVVNYFKNRHNLSEHKSCDLSNLSISSFKYVAKNRATDDELKAQLLTLSNKNYGYRRLSICLSRAGHKLNHKRVYRLYTELDLKLIKKKGKKLKTIVQLCIVHMIRNSVKYVSYRDLKAVTADLKRIYTAVNETVAGLELESFAEKGDSKYPVISDIWKRNWSGIIPIFAFPPEIRKVIYTINAIESTQKIIYLALRNAAKKWAMPIQNWALALNQFEILCGDFKYELIRNEN